MTDVTEETAVRENDRKNLLRKFAAKSASAYTDVCTTQDPVLCVNAGRATPCHRLGDLVALGETPLLIQRHTHFPRVADAPT